MESRARQGYPGPIVSTDKVFVAGTVDKEREVVRALDRQTGRELWRSRATRSSPWTRAIRFT